MSQIEILRRSVLFSNLLECCGTERILERTSGRFNGLQQTAAEDEHIKRLLLKAHEQHVCFGRLVQLCLRHYYAAPPSLTREA
eukprot:scaffold83_cov181-Amphora_coffeaeformis.AAC.2